MHNVCCDAYSMKECSNVLNHWKEDVDGIELLKHFCSTLFNSIPVYIISQTSSNPEKRIMFCREGAKECFTKPLEAMHVANIKQLFEVQQNEVSNISNNYISGSNKQKSVLLTNNAVNDDGTEANNKIFQNKQHHL
jgi:DNA-binding response OmpR family regulator